LHPSGVAKSSTSFGWGKGWNVTSAGWQVILCDPIWHVSSSSGEACCELLYPVTFYFTYMYFKFRDTGSVSRAPPPHPSSNPFKPRGISAAFPLGPIKGRSSGCLGELLLWLCPRSCLGFQSLLLTLLRLNFLSDGVARAQGRTSPALRDCRTISEAALFHTLLLICAGLIAHDHGIMILPCTCTSR